MTQYHHVASLSKVDLPPLCRFEGRASLVSCGQAHLALVSGPRVVIYALAEATKGVAKEAPPRDSHKSSSETYIYST